MHLTRTHMVTSRTPVNCPMHGRSTLTTTEDTNSYNNALQHLSLPVSRQRLACQAVTRVLVWSRILSCRVSAVAQPCRTAKHLSHGKHRTCVTVCRHIV